MASNMDFADKIELDRFVDFPSTRTKWKIVERLSAYPDEENTENCMPRSNSFAKSYTFRVELASSPSEADAEDIASPAILKIRAKWSLHHEEMASDAIETRLLREIRALEQLRLNSCGSVSEVYDATVVRFMHKADGHHGFARDRAHSDAQREMGAGAGGHFVTFVLMKDLPGINLGGDVFGRLLKAERDKIRTAFCNTLKELHRCWVVIPHPSAKHLLWDREGHTLRIINLEGAYTFNKHGLMTDRVEGYARSLPTRYLQWDDQWFTDWGLVGEKEQDCLDAVMLEGPMDYEDVVGDPQMPVQDAAVWLRQRIIEHEEFSNYQSAISLWNGRGRCVMM